MSNEDLPPGVRSVVLPPDPTEVLEKLRDLVSTGYQQHETAALHIRAMALIGRLKSLYRAANTATRIHKEETAAARQEMDQSHLNLQNLLYEKRHLEREIEKCRQFAYVLLYTRKSCLTHQQLNIPGSSPLFCRRIHAAGPSRSAHQRRPR